MVKYSRHCYSKWRIVVALLCLVMIQACAVHEPSAPNLLDQLAKPDSQVRSDRDSKYLDEPIGFIFDHQNPSNEDEQSIPLLQNGLAGINSDQDLINQSELSTNIDGSPIKRQANNQPLWNLGNRLVRFATRKEIEDFRRSQAQTKTKGSAQIDESLLGELEQDKLGSRSSLLSYTTDLYVDDGDITQQNLEETQLPWGQVIIELSRQEDYLQAQEANKNRKVFEEKIANLKTLQKRAVQEQHSALLSLPTLDDKVGSADGIVNSIFSNEDKIDQYYNIALMVPLSGKLKEIGESMRDSAMLALFDLNYNNIKLSVYDTASNYQTIQQTTLQIIHDKVDVILGPVLSENTVEVSNIIAQHHIPLISFSNSKDAITAQSTTKPTTYVMGFLPEQQIDTLLKTLSNKHNTSNVSGNKQEGVVAQIDAAVAFGLLVPDSAYGRLVSDVFVKKATKFNDVNVKIEFYKSDTKDFSENIKRLTNWQERKRNLQNKLKELDLIQSRTFLQNQEIAQLSVQETLGDLPFKYLLVASSDQIELRTIAAQLDYFDAGPNKLQIIGLQAWQNFEGLGNEPALDGAWFVGAPDKPWKIYHNKFKEVYKRSGGRFGALAYDALAISAYLINQGTDFSTNLLVENGFSTTNGAVRFLSNGLNERLYTLYSIDPQGINVVDDAPPSFNNAIVQE